MRILVATALLLGSLLLHGCSGGGPPPAAETEQPAPAPAESSQPHRASRVDLVALYAEDPARALRQPLACPTGERRYFVYDQSTPAPDATVEDALGEAANAAQVVDVSQTEVLALVTTKGRVRKVLVVTRWPNGGWAVDSGARCAS